MPHEDEVERKAMEVEHLLGEDWQFATFQRVRDTVLVVADTWIPGTRGDWFLTVAFEMRGGSLRQVGPVSRFPSPVHLGELASLGPEPFLAHMAPGALVVSDVRDGTVSRTFPLTGTTDTQRAGNVLDLALGHHDGRDLLFLHEDDEGGLDRGWRTWDLATGDPLPGSGDGAVCYRSANGGLTVRHGYLAHITIEEVVHVGPEHVDAIDTDFLTVHRVGDGTGRLIGSVPVEGCSPDDRRTEIARAGGRTYLAQGGSFFTLPDLEPALPRDAWLTMSRVTEWAGRPVAVLLRQPNSYRGETRGLCFVFLDESAPERHVLPWTGPPHLALDLLATPEGTIMVSSKEGVHVMRVDPEETVRSAERG